MASRLSIAKVAAPVSALRCCEPGSGYPIKSLPSPPVLAPPARAAEVNEAQIYITDAGYRVLPGSIPEKIAYRRASDEGRALTETRFPTLNARADRLAQSIIDLVSKLKRTA